MQEWDWRKGRWAIRCLLDFRRRGGICRGFVVAMLEWLMVFFSMSDSVEAGEQERRERCFRKGMRMLKAIVGGTSKTIGRRRLPLLS